jgi:uncharacterized protein
MPKIDESSPEIELTEEKLGRLAAVLDREGVVSASLFGSQAGGTAGPLSDIDIAVWLDPSIDRRERFDRRLALMADAAGALETSEVDLVVLNDAPPLLQHRAIGSQTILVDRDPCARIRLQTRAILSYLDTKPLRDEQARGLRKSLAEGRFGRP